MSYRRSVVKKKPGATAAELFAYFKSVGRLFISEHNGDLWVTDSYLLMRVDPTGPLVYLLEDYNLPLEPMVCDVGRTIRRRPAEHNPPPTVSGLFPRLGGLVAIAPMQLGGSDVHIESDNKMTLCVLEGGGLRIAVDVSKRRLIERMLGDGEWRHQGAPHKPVAYVVEDAVVGLVMPVRTMQDLAAEAKEAA